ncbi:MAG: iron-sulfur cluster insertion protein ErpA [Rhodobiaceae bacterium]|nr:iron-sulfur cluster insertion protein ErpA [Rhodobiaceae bacterium]MBT6223559.1 iron-sulfur cluster insertion protein ErpA [Rhodobiaceae bacterium]
MTVKSIEISDNAANKICELLKKENKDIYFRISVTGGGCSGFQYEFSTDSKLTANDEIYKHKEATILIDKVSIKFLLGSAIDYKEDLIESSFKINNPNAASSCGCGTSFSI